MGNKLKKDDQYDLVVGQCRHCHKTYQRLRYSYYILAMLCSAKCTILYYAKRYYRGTCYYIINTGLFTPPFDTTNIEWRRANKPIILHPVELKEVTDYAKTIIPTAYGLIRGQIVLFFNFIIPIIKHNLYLLWRLSNLATATILISILGLITTAIAASVIILRSSIWLTTRATTLSIATVYIFTMLLVQLLRIIFIIPAIIFSIVTIGFNTLVEPVGNFVKNLNHRYPRLPLYESLCLTIFLVYGTHNYTMFTAHANIPEVDIISSFTTKEYKESLVVESHRADNQVNTKEEGLKEIDSPALSKSKQNRQEYLEARKIAFMKRLEEQNLKTTKLELPVELATPIEKKTKDIESTKTTLLAKLKEQEKRIKASRTKKRDRTVKTGIEPTRDIIKKIVTVPKSKQIKERVMVASIEKPTAIKTKKANIRPSIKKHKTTTKKKPTEINPQYAISDFKRGNKKRLDMSFTFDGGSLDNQVDIVLETLKKHKITTTFFLTGQFIENYPNRVLQILRGGHEIANHTLDHPHLTSFEKNRKHNTILSKETFLKQLKATEQNYFKVTGKKMAPFWRAPYGEVNSEIISWAFEAGYVHVGWTTNRSTRESLDTLDWVADKNSRIYYSPEGIRNKIMSFEKSSNGLRGGIVLMHLGTNRKSDSATEVLGKMFRDARKRGYRPTKVSTLYSNKDIMHPLAKSLIEPYLNKNRALAKKDTAEKDVIKPDDRAELLRKIDSAR